MLSRPALAGPGDCCGGVGTHGSGYLGPEHAGVYLEVDPDRPLPFVSPGPDVYQEEQKREFEFLNKLNRISAVEYPADRALAARIKSYELAFRMQMAVPEAINFKDEIEETKQLYGLDQENTKGFGQVCLAARRLSERGVRFVQVYHGGAAMHGTLIKIEEKPFGPGLQSGQADCRVAQGPEAARIA